MTSGEFVFGKAAERWKSYFVKKLLFQQLIRNLRSIDLMIMI